MVSLNFEVQIEEVSSAEPEPGPGDIERKLDKYARLNQRLNSTDEIYVELNDKIQANAEAISSLQTFVANMHEDMNAGFAVKVLQYQLRRFLL